MAERLVFNYGTSGHAGSAPSRDERGEDVHRSAEPSRLVETGAPPAGLAAPRATARTRSDWAFTGLMAFTAILFFRPQDQMPFLNPLHLAEIAALIGLVAMVSGRLQRGQTVTRITPELVGVGALGAVILLMAPLSIWPGGSVATFTDVYVKVILIFVLMVNTLTTTKRFEQFMWLMVLATGYIAFRAVFDYARGFNLIENGRVQGAVGGIFRNPNDLALNMVAVLPLALLIALHGRTRVRRVVAAVGAVLMVGTVIASHSRSGSVGLVAMTALLAVYLLRRRPGLVLAGVLLFALALPLAPESYWQRLSSITDASQDDTGSREARRVLLREGFAAFVANPLTGVGAGQFKNYAPEGRDEAWRETHNVLLQVAAELGVLGLLAFTFLIVRAAMTGRQVKRLLKRAVTRQVVTADEASRLDAHAAAMSAALAGWFVCALFASVAYNWTFYYLLALAAAPREMLIDRLPARRRSRAGARTDEAERASKSERGEVSLAGRPGPRLSGEEARA
jgi:O-antigen ligase